MVQGKSVAQPLGEIASGFVKPVDIAHTTDDRLFIVEQRGIIKIIDQDRTVLNEPFLDIRNLVNDNGNERGLLGLAFHPSYENNGQFFVNYTSGNNTIIARYTVSTDDLNIANRASELVIMTISQPFPNHNGGGIQFGADGYLYIGLGDGGSGGDPRNFSQNPSSLLGKMLRIDVDNGDPYAIPADRWEEVSWLAADSPFGANYGWRCFEGFANFIPADCEGESDLILPVHVYATGGPDGASITGGFVYRGTRQPSLQGHYIYGDYVSKKIFSITRDEAGNWVNQELLRSISNISTFGEDATGELYVAGHVQGRIFQIMDDQTTSTTEMPLSNLVQISPNPFEEFIQLQVVGEQSKQPLQLQVFNLQGQLLFEKKINSIGSEKIPLVHLPKGVYWMQLQQSGQTFLQKLVKQ